MKSQHSVYRKMWKMTTVKFVSVDFSTCSIKIPKAVISVSVLEFQTTVSIHSLLIPRLEHSRQLTFSLFLLNFSHIPISHILHKYSQIQNMFFQDYFNDNTINVGVTQQYPYDSILSTHSSTQTDNKIHISYVSSLVYPENKKH